MLFVVFVIGVVCCGADVRSGKIDADYHITLKRWGEHFRKHDTSMLLLRCCGSVFVETRVGVVETRVLWMFETAFACV